MQGLSHFESTREIRQLGSWNTLPGRRSGLFSSSSFFLHDIFYICSENAVHMGGFLCGFVQLAAYERRVPDFIALFAFNFLLNAR